MTKSNLPAIRVELSKLPNLDKDFGYTFKTTYLTIINSKTINHHYRDSFFNTKEEAIKYRNKMYKRIKKDGYIVTCDDNKKDKCEFFIWISRIKYEIDPNFDY